LFFINKNLWLIRRFFIRPVNRAAFTLSFINLVDVPGGSSLKMFGFVSSHCADAGIKMMVPFILAT
jgi:hypothetical protein